MFQTKLDSFEVKPFSWPVADEHSHDCIGLFDNGEILLEDEVFLFRLVAEHRNADGYIDAGDWPDEEELDSMTREEFGDFCEKRHFQIYGCISFGTETLSSLPENFCSHEFLELNADDDAELVRFSEKWGLLFSPYRFNTAPHRLITETEKHAIAFTDNAEVPEWGSLENDFVSLEEMRVTAKHLQDAIRVLVRARLDSGNADWSEARYRRVLESSTYIQSGTAYPSWFSFVGDNSNEMNAGNYATSEFRCLTNAVCNQVFELLTSDSYPLSVCPVCGHAYRNMRHDKRPPKTDKLSPNAPRYCSDTCSDRARDKRKRENRKKRKAEQLPNPAE